MKTRLQRFLADCGVASRRECEALILDGRVRVNGEIKTRMPVLIDTTKDLITVDDEKISLASFKESGPTSAVLKEQDKVYFLLNKPKGILVTNADPSDRKTVNELMTGVRERVFPVGRLDMDSRGALIMTNDGELANRLTHPRYGIEKTYIVEVDGRMGHEDLEKLKRGIWLTADPHARAAPKPGAAGAVAAFKTERFKAKIVGRERGRTILELTLSEAKNSEIRRVMARLGHTVRDLNRVAIGAGATRVTTKGLEVGKFRPLSPQEIKSLLRASSPEFHSQQKTATQAWYEAKEMEKERKRLAREGAEDARTRALKPKPQPNVPGAEAHARKELRPRPLRSERRGKKPFVPPTGRNAGKLLGGNLIGKQRLQRELDDTGLDLDPPTHSPGKDDTPAIPSTPRVAHPLGDAATSDE